MADVDSNNVVKHIRYCGGPSVDISKWFTATTADAILSQRSPQLRNLKVIGTYRGRTAIALACQLLGIGKDHEVLMPAYNCGTEVDAILHTGASVVGYRITRTCEIDLADLKARQTKRTKAV